MADIIEIEATVEKIISTINPNFVLIKAKGCIDDTKKIHTFSAKGKIPSPTKKDVIKMKGYWTSDSYGPYFYVAEASNNLSEKENIILNFLLSGFIKGLTYKAARELVAEYGHNVLDALRNPAELIKIKDIGKTRLSQIIESYNQNIGFLKLFELSKGAITVNLLKKIVAKYENEAYEKLQTNPYQLIYDFKGIGFLKADKIALDMGMSETDPRRYKAAITYALESAETDGGHVFLYQDELEQRALSVLFPRTSLKNIFYKDVLQTTIPSNDSKEWDDLKIAKMPERSLNYMLNSWSEYDEKREAFKSEKFIKDYELSLDEADTIDTYLSKKSSFCDILPNLLIEEVNEKHLVIDDNRIYVERNYNIECKISTMLTSLLKAKDFTTTGIKFPSKENIISAISKVEKEEGHELGDLQIKAVGTSLTKKVSIITGGPGRGKTTIIKTILEGWKAAGNSLMKCVLLAPTGRAAQRMTESIGNPREVRAQTIHRLILQSGGLSGCLIIVDEFSMVDMFLIYKLLKLGFDKNIFIFVGDHNQLPSVGAGKVLKDLINSSIIPYTYLSKCYRSSGSISKNVDNINEGANFKDLTFDSQFHFYKIDKENKDKTLMTVVNLYKQLINKYSTKDVAILTNRRKDRVISSDNLNKEIQTLLNPVTNSNDELKINMYGETRSFRVNDRVMHTKNDYNIPVKVYEPTLDKTIDALGCFNGETGTIIAVDSYDKTVTVKFDDGKLCVYTVEYLDELILAYAITVHKSQGSEYKAIIHIENSDDYIMLSKPIFYTATSRGKQEVHLVGDPSCFNTAIKNVVVAERNTYLSERLKADFLRDDPQN